MSELIATIVLHRGSYRDWKIYIMNYVNINYFWWVNWKIKLKISLFLMFENYFTLSLYKQLAFTSFNLFILFEDNLQ